MQLHARRYLLCKALWYLQLLHGIFWGCNLKNPGSYWYLCWHSGDGSLIELNTLNSDRIASSQLYVYMWICWVAK